MNKYINILLYIIIVICSKLTSQGTKIYGKSVLRMVPIIGWMWIFTESIFLKRQWDLDKKIIARDLAYLTKYPPHYWVTVSIYVS